MSSKARLQLSAVSDEMDFDYDMESSRDDSVLTPLSPVVQPVRKTSFVQDGGSAMSTPRRSPQEDDILHHKNKLKSHRVHSVTALETADEVSMRERQERLEREASEGFGLVYMERGQRRKAVFMLLAEPESSIAAQLIAMVMMALILLSSAALVLETVAAVKKNDSAAAALHVLERICITCFSAEYLGRVLTCTTRPGEVIPGARLCSRPPRPSEGC